MTKSEQRKIFIRMRDGIDGRKERDEIICRNISQTAEYAKCKKLFCYYPVRGEINLLGLINRARADGKVTALPVIREGKMFFREFDGKSKPGRFDIPEPTGDEITPDGDTLCIVPGLGYDGEKYRIGYGGGYYDRFLRDFAGVSLGAFYSEFCAKKLPREEYDIPLDIIITEKGIF